MVSSVNIANTSVCYLSTTRVDYVQGPIIYWSLSRLQVRVHTCSCTYIHTYKNPTLVESFISLLFCKVVSTMIRRSSSASMKLLLQLALLASTLIGQTCSEEYIHVHVHVPFDLQPAMAAMFGVRGHLRGHSEYITNSIMGGSKRREPRELSDYPFFVRIHNSDGLFTCSGSLVAPEFVLTAAHCAEEGLTVAINGNNNNNLQHTVSMVWMHPNFTHDSYHYDIMLLQLGTPSQVEAVKFNRDRTTPTVSDSLSILGFSAEQHMMDEEVVRTIDDTICRTIYASLCNVHGIHIEFLETVQFCAWSEIREYNRIHTTTISSSGGPILDEHGVQLGVVSFGQNLGEVYPHVYASTSAVSEWMEQAICEHSHQHLSPAWCDRLSRRLQEDANQDTKEYEKDFLIMSPAQFIFLPPSAAPSEASLPIGQASANFPTPPLVFGRCDDTNDVLFKVAGVYPWTRTDCAWLRANGTTYIADVCVPGHAAYSLCSGTCDSCPNDKTDSPTLSPLPFGSCDDIEMVLFKVKGAYPWQRTDCSWLKGADGSKYRATACVEDQPAYTVCPGTCNSCIPTTNSTTTRGTCSDTDTVLFSVPGVYPWTKTDCAWLRGSIGTSHRDAVCVRSHPAYNICRGTCNSCPTDNDGSSSAPSQSPPAVAFGECQDTAAVLFQLPGSYPWQMTDCNYLRARPLLIPAVCHKEHPAYYACPSTCNSCSMVEKDSIIMTSKGILEDRAGRMKTRDASGIFLTSDDGREEQHLNKVQQVVIGEMLRAGNLS